MPEAPGGTPARRGQPRARRWCLSAALPAKSSETANRRTNAARRRIALVLLQTALCRASYGSLARRRGRGPPAPGAAAMLDASDGSFDRAIVADAADDERFTRRRRERTACRDSAFRWRTSSRGGSTLVGGDASQSAAIALVGSVAWCHVDATAGQPCIVAENCARQGRLHGHTDRVHVPRGRRRAGPGLCARQRRRRTRYLGRRRPPRGRRVIAKAQRAETAAPDEDAAAARDAPAGPSRRSDDGPPGVSDGGVAPIGWR